MTTAEIVEKTRQENTNKNASSEAKKAAAIAADNNKNAVSNKQLSESKKLAAQRQAEEDALFQDDMIEDLTNQPHKSTEQVLEETYRAAHRDPRSEMNAAEKLWDTVSGEQKIREAGVDYHAKAQGAMGIPDDELIKRWQSSTGDDRKIYAAEVESRARDIGSPLSQYGSAAQMDRMKDEPLKDLGAEAAFTLAGAKQFGTTLGALKNTKKHMNALVGNTTKSKLNDFMVKKAIGKTAVEGGKAAATTLLGSGAKAFANDGGFQLGGNRTGFEYTAPIGQDTTPTGEPISVPEADNTVGPTVSKVNPITQMNAILDQAAGVTSKVEDTDIPTPGEDAPIKDNMEQTPQDTSDMGSANQNLPSEPGFDNDAVKTQAKKDYEAAREGGKIGLSEDPNKTNYVNDEWNQGMVKESTDVVSDERCKKFIRTVMDHEPAMANGFKKIVTIIREGR